MTRSQNTRTLQEELELFWNFQHYLKGRKQ